LGAWTVTSAQVKLIESEAKLITCQRTHTGAVTCQYDRNRVRTEVILKRDCTNPIVIYGNFVAATRNIYSARGISSPESRGGGRLSRLLANLRDPGGEASQQRRAKSFQASVSKMQDEEHRALSGTCQDSIAQETAARAYEPGHCKAEAKA